MPSHFPEFPDSQPNLLDSAFGTTLECCGRHAHELSRLVALTRELERSLHAGELRAQLIPLIRDVTGKAHGQAERSLLVIRELQETVLLEARWKELYLGLDPGDHIALTGTSVH